MACFAKLTSNHTKKQVPNISQHMSKACPQTSQTNVQQFPNMSKKCPKHVKNMSPQSKKRVQHISKACKKASTKCKTTQPFVKTCAYLRVAPSTPSIHLHNLQEPPLTTATPKPMPDIISDNGAVKIALLAERIASLKICSKSNPKTLITKPIAIYAHLSDFDVP